MGLNIQSGWIISEKEFKKEYIAKSEVIMAIGNGYMGSRATNEESYYNQTRNTFVAGSFNKSNEDEVTELPNFPDITNIEIFIDGYRFTLLDGEIIDFEKNLNLKNGKMLRKITWRSPNDKIVDFEFMRFISLNNLHLIGSKINISSNENIKIKIISGINGQVTNSGAMHFTDGVKRIFDSNILRYTTETLESKINAIVQSSHNILINDKDIEIAATMKMDRRIVNLIYNYDLEANKVFKFEKISTIHTSRDLEYAKCTFEEIKEKAINDIKNYKSMGYDVLFNESEIEWMKYWNDVDIKIDSKDIKDQFAIRFAQYHLRIMTNFEDNRMGIGAKGLTGEGYKGHSFWDTEIFILPFYIYNLPEIARNLLVYRYKTLDGAHNKAIENGYKGAMFPWESAWISDDDVTPLWCGVNVVTGKATKVYSGIKEQHISADIVYAIWLYYTVTKDNDFMELYGYEMIFDIVLFIESRLEYNKDIDRYEVNDVIGADEYKERINNNTFTNNMFKFAMNLGIKYYDELKENNEALLLKINEKVLISNKIESIKEKSNKIFIPEMTKDLIIPQDDTYLSKEIIDLTKYKNQTYIDSIFEDYNIEQLREIQVTKQADVIMLLQLLNNNFSKDIVKANWDYYEPKTLHDSSLSLATHVVMASEVNDIDYAYKLFRKAIDIDLGKNMNSSDKGIHSASLGGIWQSVVYGFAGVKIVNNILSINPRLPKEWNEIEMPLIFNDIELLINLTHEVINVKVIDNEAINVVINGKNIKIQNEIRLVK
ncbi:glycosyl hydrolase family 65 protein [Clostridiaceae bacterium HSG29]|nr:glycosyl hydrolase family 65 protein [Clostridiaceae bacterium HSG29]